MLFRFCFLLWKRMFYCLFHAVVLLLQEKEWLNEYLLFPESHILPFSLSRAGCRPPGRWIYVITGACRILRRRSMVNPLRHRGRSEKSNRGVSATRLPRRQRSVRSILLRLRVVRPANRRLYLSWLRGGVWRLRSRVWPWELSIPWEWCWGYLHRPRYVLGLITLVKNVPTRKCIFKRESHWYWENGRR